MNESVSFNQIIFEGKADVHGGAFFKEVVNEIVVQLPDDWNHESVNRVALELPGLVVTFLLYIIRNPHYFSETVLVHTRPHNYVLLNLWFFVDALFFDSF